MDYVHQRFEGMLRNTHSFLGRNWLRLHVQAKSRKKLGDAEASKTGVNQFMLVALSGHELEPLDVCTLVNFSVPLLENADMSLCKAGARIDLKMSRTTRVMTLMPEEIEYIPDSYSTHDAPDTQFNDPNLSYDANETKDEERVMNDGCSMADPSVFHLIGQQFECDDPPSAAQFRCAGSKGMIFCGWDEDSGQRPDWPVKVRLQLTESQVKVKLKKGDRDHHQRALDIVKISHAITGPSFLYVDFMPLMIDRHVPRKVIEDCALRQIKRSIDEFQQALQGRESLRDWISTKRF